MKNGKFKRNAEKANFPLVVSVNIILIVITKDCYSNGRKNMNPGTCYLFCFYISFAPRDTVS